MNKNILYKFIILMCSIYFLFFLVNASFANTNLFKDREQAKKDEVNIFNANSWTKNTLTLKVNDSDFTIGTFNPCNNNLSCKCENIPFTKIPGKGKFKDLSGMNLRGVNWNSQQLGNSHLKLSRLEGANLTNSNLGFALLAQSSLDNAVLVKTNLAGANLQKANLRGANLEGAILFDGDMSSAYPVSFYRKWKSLTIDTKPLLKGTYIDQLNLEMCAGGETYITFLLLKGNGANVEGADFTNAKNLSKENMQYICRWGGEFTRKTLGSQCDSIPSQSNNNPFAAVINDVFLAKPELVNPAKNQVVESLEPELVIAFDHAVVLRPDAIEIRTVDQQASISSRLDKPLAQYLSKGYKRFSFRLLSRLEPGVNYEVVLLSGKAMDSVGNLLKEELVLGSFRVSSQI